MKKFEGIIATTIGVVGTGLIVGFFLTLLVAAVIGAVNKAREVSVTTGNTPASVIAYQGDKGAKYYLQVMHKCAAMALAQHKKGMPKEESNLFYQECLIYFEATI